MGSSGYLVVGQFALIAQGVKIRKLFEEWWARQPMNSSRRGVGDWS
jgi:hypothetical protein